MAEIAPLKQPDIKVEILIENQERFQAGIRRAQGSMRDLTAPLTQIGLMLYKSQRAIFNLQGPGLYPDLSTGSGRQRKFLSEGKGGVTYAGGYKLRKLKKWGFIYPILKASGALETSTTVPGSEHSVMRIVDGGLALEWGTSVPYGIFHQSHEPRKKMPFRPFLIWAADSRYAPDVASARIGRSLNILNAWTLKAMGKNAPRTGDEG